MVKSVFMDTLGSMRLHLAYHNRNVWLQYVGVMFCSCVLFPLLTTSLIIYYFRSLFLFSFIQVSCLNWLSNICGDFLYLYHCDLSISTFNLTALIWACVFCLILPKVSHDNPSSIYILYRGPEWPGAKMVLHRCSHATIDWLHLRHNNQKDLYARTFGRYRFVNKG